MSNSLQFSYKLNKRKISDTHLSSRIFNRGSITVPYCLDKAKLGRLSKNYTIHLKCLSVYTRNANAERTPQYIQRKISSSNREISVPAKSTCSAARELIVQAIKRSEMFGIF